MDSDHLRDLLIRGETLTAEFKGGSINDSDLVEAVACLSNGSGGVLLVGVDDEGNVVGAEPRHGSETHPNRLQSLIVNKTEPAVTSHSRDQRS
ncbi:MAG: ATP-binding protein [Acidimicrobiaceae bacterium]|nr:ATP-binding protein [Acidimicrobiaceae bacterium]MXZ99583.1 ATP-binding protein [Acidimicrobiaceae bacterium]MYE75201.1 ATP-binding protein [Acidimicrobiaceae bacterium]MYE96147.1 ATP-binding protein [Acidimicrobiaceae bacterium]MYH44447.1 ATP-binding protein [Acidimicrobiaceae bacterium]